MANTHRQILRASSIIGGSSAVNILIGLLRVKVAAILLGPAGVGLIGLIQNLVSTASALSSLGFANAGVRQIAEANGRNDEGASAAARRALFWGTVVLAGTGAGAVWLFRHALAREVLGDPQKSGTVGWLALGVAITVATWSQSSLLVAHRRLGDLARMSVISALLSSAIAIPALIVWGIGGVLVFALSAPVTTFFVGWYYTSRLPRPAGGLLTRARAGLQWGTTARLCLAFTISSLTATGGELLVRTAIQRDLGVVAVGHFQAAWTISITYLGFVLFAMGTDFNPRLAAVIGDRQAVNRIANEQIEVALLLASPVLIGMMGSASWVIALLYSSEFADSADILRWLILGDALKIVVWPLMIVLQVLADPKRSIATDFLGMSVFVGLTWFALPLFGLEGAGIAFIGMLLATLPAAYVAVRTRTGFRFDWLVLRRLGALLVALIVTLLASHVSPVAGILCGTILAALFGVSGLLRLEGALPAPLSRFVMWGRTYFERARD